ncbi:glycosyltransferase family 4 protein [Sphingosinicella sp. CPCC 101087]|uniref:glycosyltransferase family 4 protein n=1 Tax=Sphingosinicella sp. CPCC 101087 TaxID=2497754 RepID=UPI00101B98C1|nr:glycosyltransferase family 4 protein [Sphingosinicella sp. CPCC 101087]
MTAKPRRLLYIDMAYTMEIVRRKGHHQFFEMRHSGGYFDHVWGVHPLADAAGKRSRQIETIPFTDRQTIIEGAAEMLPLPRLLLPLNFIVSQWRLVRRLERLIEAEDIDLIFATDAYYSGLLGLVLKRLTGRPEIVAVFANQDDLYAATGALAMPRLLPFRFLEQWMARLVLSRADLVIAGNRNNMGFAKANGARGETAIIPVGKNIEAAHLAPPAERESPAALLQALGVPPGAPKMLFVGRLLALKHPDEAVRAMAGVIAERPDAVGLVAGSGPMQAELESLARSLGAEGQIHFLGHIEQAMLARLTPHCITLSPLTGMALIECGLGGSPMVAFDRDWQAEFVEDGVNGFVVPFLDYDAMARRVLEIIADPALRARMSAAARERSLEFADKDRIYAREHALYDRLLARFRR